MFKQSQLKQHSLRIIMNAMLALTLIGCSKAPLEPLSIASSPWPGYEPLYLARELGYLDEDKFQLLDLPSSDITMESFRNGSADFGTLTMDETMELISDGVPLRIVAALDVSNGADAAIARPEIKKLSDIKGKRISIINISLGFYMLNRLLDKAGLEREDVDVYPMAEIKQEKFYKDGKADVVITFDPMKSRIVKQGGHVIFDSSEIPNEIIDFLVVHEKVYQERRADVCELVGRWYRALDYIKAYPQESSIKISERLNVTVTEYKEIMKGVNIVSKEENVKLLSGKNPALLPVANNLIKVMVANKLLPATVDVNKAIDVGFTSCI